MLTKKQRDLLIFIHERMQSGEVAPSFEEMKQHLDLKSKSGIHRLITGLVERGFLERLPHRARALNVVRLPDGYIEKSSQDSTPTNDNSEYNKNIDTIPLYGKIAAGTPIEAIRHEGESVAIPSGIIGGGAHYALLVEGDSMINAGIHEGDTVIIEKTDKFRDGDIVVALVDDAEATLKRIKRDGHTVALIPENPSHDIRLLEANRVQVQGKLASLYRTYH